MPAAPQRGQQTFNFIKEALVRQTALLSSVPRLKDAAPLRTTETSKIARIQGSIARGR